MDLKIEDVAEMLNVQESTVVRWLEEGTIPSYQINRQYRFNRDEIETWMLQQKEDLFGDEVQVGIHRFNLYRAMHKGGVYSDVPGNSKEEVIRAAVDLMAPNLQLDAGVLSDMLLDRERLMPTGLGNGIGVPHARDFLLSQHYDAVVTVFPREPIVYGSLDGAPVHTLFFLLACDDKRHLNLLAKIAHLASDEKAVSQLQSRPTKKELLDQVKSWESTLNH
jgi:nitrogen PTS system EIIA component